MKKKPPRDPVASFEREARAVRRVGQSSRCHLCGEDRPLALIPGSKPLICAACQRKKLGHSLLDNHHPAGEANDPTTTPILVNDHRAILSPEQYEWPQETWDNPLGSPILASAACIRGYCETDSYLVASLLIPKVEMLEALEVFLKEQLGSEWWIGTEMDRFAPKRKPKRKVYEERVRKFAPRTNQINAGRRRRKTMNVGSYVKNGSQQGRLPLLDASLFRKLEKKGVVTGKMISCRQVNTPRFKGLVMEFKNGPAKFSYLASFDRWDIGALALQLGSEETNDWVGRQVRFIIHKGQKGGTFINVEKPKKARP